MELKAAGDAQDIAERMDLPVGTNISPIRELLTRIANLEKANAFFMEVGGDEHVWVDDASPFTGPQVRELLEENERLRMRVAPLDTALARVEELGADGTRLDWLDDFDNLYEIHKRWIRLEQPFDLRGAVDAAMKESGR